MLNYGEGYTRLEWHLELLRSRVNITYPIDSWNRAILSLDYKISFIIYCFKSESYASGDIAIKMK